MKKMRDNRIVQAIAAILMSFVMMLVGQLLGLALCAPLELSDSAVLKFIGDYLSFIGIWIMVIAFCWFRKKNRKLLPKLGRGGKGNNLKTVLLIGLPCGIGLNLIVAIAAILHKDIYLSFNEINPVLILAFLISVTVQSSAEELVDRFYLYQKISDIFPGIPLLPVIINAAAFSAGHLLNPGVTPLALANIVLSGVLFSLIIYYFDSFWAAAIAHASWNFCQSILLGLPNSGIVSAYSIFKLDAAKATNSFAYNVNFGIESTILSSLVLAAACVVIVFIGKKKGCALRGEL